MITVMDSMHYMIRGSMETICGAMGEGLPRTRLRSLTTCPNCQAAIVERAAAIVHLRPNATEPAALCNTLTTNLTSDHSRVTCEFCLDREIREQMDRVERLATIRDLQKLRHIIHHLLSIN